MPDTRAHAELPVDSLKAAAAHLRRPFAPAAIRWKVQASFKDAQERPTGGLIVPYIDARLVIERLNAVCPHLWHDAYEQLSPQLMRCDLTVDGVTRHDVGEGQGKGLWSDSFKRAAVKFGIGVSIYALPKIMLNVGGKPNELATGRAQGKAVAKLKDSNAVKLREGYEKWLEATGVEAFGPVLDHGDVVDSVGADEEAAPAGVAGDGQAPLTGEPAKDLRDEAMSLFVAEGRRAPGLELRGQLEEALQGAQTLEELDAIVKSLQGPA